MSRTTIDALVTAAIKWTDDTDAFRYYWRGGVGRVTPETATSVGQMLWSANWYHADGWVEDTDWAERGGVPEPVYAYEALPGVPDPAIVLRVISNYVYQTAGHPDDWRPSEPFGFVYALQVVAIERLLHDVDLPWGIGDDDRDLFRRYGTVDPEPEPSDADNPAWAATYEKLTATGIPFKAYTPHERRNQRGEGDAVLLGRWASWPPDLGSACVLVSLHDGDAEAADGFARAVTIAQQRVGPRWSPEVLRVGRTVLTLVTDAWNPDLDDGLSRIRTAFGDPDDYWSVSHVRRTADAPLIVRRWNDDGSRWDATRDGEAGIIGVQNLADAHLAAEQRGVFLLVDNDVYRDMVERGDAPPDRPAWAVRRPAGGLRLP